MDLIEIYYSQKKRLLILGLGLVLGLAAGYVGVRLQTPVYQATAKILVVQNQSTQTSDLLSLNNQQLVQTYIELLKTKPIFDAASAKLGVVIDPNKVSVMQITANQIIHVTVEDSDSQRVAQIANTLVRVLIDQNIEAESDRYSTYETALNSQIEDAQKQISSLEDQIWQFNEARLNQLNGQITQLEADIATLELDIAKLPLASRVEKEYQLEQSKSLLNSYQQIRTNLITIGKSASSSAVRDDARIASLQLMLDHYRQLYLTSMNNLQILQMTRFQNTSNITQIDPAVPPVDPIRPKPMLYLILAGTAGMLLGFGVILLLGYFDNTLKTSSDTEELLLGLSVLGTISSQRQPMDGPIVAHHPTAREAQGYLKLGAVLELTNNKKNIQSLVVTSPGSGEGKSTIAANLASVYSRQGKRVLLIDANFNHPSLHSLLGLNNEHGFAEILHGSKEFAPQHYHNGDVGGFLALPVGESNQPNELHQVEKVSQALNYLKTKADLLILDVPSLSSADASMLAAQADGVLLVIKSGRTNISSAVSATQQLRRQGTQILGIVLNCSTEDQ